MNDDIAIAIETIKSGGIVIYPTDTVFGIGCRIDNEQAVNRLFTLRNRPVTQATPVLVTSVEMALPYFLDPPDIVRRLMQGYWPGGLTIISRCKKELVLSPIRGGADTIGFRMPNHKMALAMIAGVGVPVLGPSANFHEKPTPYLFEELDPELIKLVDFVVPGECSIKNVSTVVDCTGDLLKIIRQGAVVVDI